MSKKKAPQIVTKPTTGILGKPVATPVVAKEFKLPYPAVWLALVAFILYIPSFFFQFTELDDSIFIKEFAGYNEDMGNLITSFQRGVFNAAKDIYYRPLFLDSMILNYRLSGTDIMGYHVVNVLLHVICVVLLYTLLRKLDIKSVTAFILSLVFAVHPVLSQAVAWIPGRNDTLLAVFVLSFLINTISYTRTRNPVSLALSGLFLLLAYFTKETAVFAAPVAFVLVVFMLRQKWSERGNLMQYGVWAACFVIWFIARSLVIAHSSSEVGKVVGDFVHHLPLLLQYFGKIFLPFNLSVFPILEDTVTYYGIAAVVLLAALISLGKERSNRTILVGLGIFVLFVLPALLVPSDLNDQTFEHRLYLPMLGILLILPQTILFRNKLTEQQLLAGAAVICAGLAFINYEHQQKFADPVTFWSSAAETSPHSAYADMMLAARTNDLKVSDSLFRKAYRLNPKEKYLNFYYGVMLQREDSVSQSEPYLLAEKNTSNYAECDFFLARAAMERKDFNAAIAYLEIDRKRDGKNASMAENNLLLLYLQTQQRDKAITLAKEMLLQHKDVPKPLRAQLGI